MFYCVASSEMFEFFFHVKLIFSACQDIVGWKEAIKYFKHSRGRNDMLGENGRISFIHEMLC